jgi:hypothetical protein
MNLHVFIKTMLLYVEYICVLNFLQDICCIEVTILNRNINSHMLKS